MEVLARTRQAWRSFRGSLLFYPTVMMVASLVLFAVTSVADSRLHGRIEGFVRDWGGTPLGFLVFAGSPDTAGRLLAAIAGTWATIAGVAYSVTLVTIQLSATKYSAQVIPVFERDRLNQVTLGAFTGTFAYALLVLKTIRSDDGSGDGYVPFIGANLSVLFALVSLGLLIAFIGNLTAYIRPTRFVQDYSASGHEELGRLVEPAGFEGFSSARVPPGDEPPRGERVRAEADGHVAGIDWHALREVVQEKGAGIERIDVRVALGSFVVRGDEILRVSCRRPLGDDVVERLASAVQVDRVPDERNPQQIAETLADIAVTAMSGGSTDVGVAKTALRGLIDLTAEGIRQKDPGPAFEVEADGGRVLLVREREAFHLKAFREIRRITTKTRHEGYRDVFEHFALHSGRLLRAAAHAPREGTWEETIDWMRAVLGDALGIDDDRVRARLLDLLRRPVEDLREDDLEAQATDLEQAIVQAARENAVAPDVVARFARG